MICYSLLCVLIIVLAVTLYKYNLMREKLNGVVSHNRELIDELEDLIYLNKQLEEILEEKYDVLVGAGDT